MADTPSTPPRDSSSNRGGRRRGRGGGDGHRGGGERGRGGAGPGRRGGRGGTHSRGQGRSTHTSGPRARQGQTGTAQSGGQHSGEPPDPAVRGVGTSGDRLTGDAIHTEGEGKGKRPVKDEEADDGEVCFICASRVEYTSVSPCNHRTCHICALRLRALYKSKACAHCRTESSYVIFTHDPSKRYEDFTEANFVRSDENLGIKYETDEIFEDTVLLLRYNCPDAQCDAACFGWPDLHRHVKSKHGKVMCDLCTRNKKVFTHEHELFSYPQLRKHERVGDDNPGALDQSGFKGHPECGFCRQRFYGDDELYTHCRDKHERCHICDRRSGGRQQQYYVDYNALEEHFQKDHYLCLDKECLEKKFVVFESQMDLKGHQLEAHPSGVSKDIRRDERLVDLSDFDVRSPYQPQRSRRGEAGRGRDPNAGAIPVSSAQPLRRDELAYQRQMAIQSAQSVSTRTFGGQLTSSEPQPQTVRAPARPTPPQPSTPIPQFENLEITASSNPRDQARQIAHSAVVNRASSLLRNDPLKINDFRSKVSAYRTSAISANDLIESFFSLFDTSSSELGKLIKELAELYEDDTKRSSLLKAWNDWRAINEDYPSLPAPSGMNSLAPESAASGKRVLRLKSSTAQSSRSAMGRSGSLPGLFNPNSGTNPFPPLGGACAKSKPTTAWGTAAVTPNLGSARNSPGPSRPSSRGVPSGANGSIRNDSNAFPALPAAPKPNTLMAGLTRGTVRWGERNPTPGASAWGGASSNPTSAESEMGAAGEEGGKKGKGKKGKGKQLLYHFG